MGDQRLDECLRLGVAAGVADLADVIPSGWAVIRRAVDVGNDVVVRAMPIDPRDQRWQSNSPGYRVFFWQPLGSGESSRWRSEEWELTEADIDEVLAWAGSHAASRKVSIWVAHRDAGGVGLIRLAGIDPTTDRGPWPKWASPR